MQLCQFSLPLVVSLSFSSPLGKTVSLLCRWISAVLSMLVLRFRLQIWSFDRYGRSVEGNRKTTKTDKMTFRLNPQGHTAQFDPLKSDWLAGLNPPRSGGRAEPHKSHDSRAASFHSCWWGNVSNFPFYISGQQCCKVLLPDLAVNAAPSWFGFLIEPQT